jgi:hypothetical protein
MTTIKITAEARYGYEGKQWIARITGRVSGAATFAREFVGVKSGKRGGFTEALIDEPGLYETCDIDRKGNKDYSYVFFDGQRRNDGYYGREKAMHFAKHLNKLVLIEVPDKDDATKTTVVCRVRSELTPEERTVLQGAPVVSEAVRALLEQVALLSEQDRKAFFELLGV